MPDIEPLDDLDNNILVRQARLMTKGIIEQNDPREIAFVRAMLTLIGERALSQLNETICNNQASRN